MEVWKKFGSDILMNRLNRFENSVLFAFLKVCQTFPNYEGKKAANKIRI